VEKNLSRLANQWAEAVSASIDGLAGQALESIKSELTTVESLISGATDQRTDIEAALRRIEELSESPTTSNEKGETTNER
jgi:predicted ATP-grasp superfamily ATP-dependent carboligase